MGCKPHQNYSQEGFKKWFLTTLVPYIYQGIVKHLFLVRWLRGNIILNHSHGWNGECACENTSIDIYIYNISRYIYILSFIVLGYLFLALAYILIYIPISIYSYTSIFARHPSPSIFIKTPAPSCTAQRHVVLLSPVALRAERLRPSGRSWSSCLNTLAAWGAGTSNPQEINGWYALPIWKKI